MAGTTVFGRPASSSIASAVMGSASMNAAPSPSQPEHAPADGLTRKYATLFSLASDALQDEPDVGKRLELQRIVKFFDDQLSESINGASSGGAPVPNIQSAPPPPPVAPPGAIPAAAPPPTPGAMASPTPGA